MLLHTSLMRKALEVAELALLNNEVPIGAVISIGSEIIVATHNQTEKLKNATAHAEFLAISEACKILGKKYLNECTLYVTLEPCSMCAGAMVNTKLKQLVFGAYDVHAGATGTVINITNSNSLNHRVNTLGGVLDTDCSILLKQFLNQKEKNSENKSNLFSFFIFLLFSYI